MQKVSFVPTSERRLALLAAQSESTPVLIVGANGTGREGLALWIHAHGPRSAHKPISFTYHRNGFADSSVPSLQELLQKGHGSTLILNEIGDSPLQDQELLAQYLRSKTLKLDGILSLIQTRIIVTTRYDLEARARSGLFSIHLIERLKQFVLHTPALHQRQDELEDIVLEVLGEITREHHLDHIRSFSPEAWTRIKTYPWPGNIRELRNALRLATLKCEGQEVQLEDLPPLDDGTQVHGKSQGNEGNGDSCTQTQNSGKNGGRIESSLLAPREDFERQLIKETLNAVNGDLEAGAARLRISVEQLRAKLLKSGLQA